MTQSALAEELDVSSKTVSRWELDEAIPETEMIPYLAKALNLKIEDFFDPEDAVLNKKEDVKEGENKRLRFKKWCLVADIVSPLSIFLTALGLGLNATSLTSSLILIIFGILLFVCSVLLIVLARMDFTSYYKKKYRESEYREEDLRSLLLYQGITFTALLVFLTSFWENLFQDAIFYQYQSISYNNIIWILILVSLSLLTAFLLLKGFQRGLDLTSHKAKAFLITMICLLLSVIGFGFNPHPVFFQIGYDLAPGVTLAEIFLFRNLK